MGELPRESPCRVAQDSAVRGWCIDCKKEVAGKVALLVIISDGVPGIVVGVADGGELHSLCRVELHVIPVVPL